MDDLILTSLVLTVVSIGFACFSLGFSIGVAAGRTEAKKEDNDESTATEEAD